MEISFKAHPPIAHTWNGQYFLGQYFPDLLLRPAKESLGTVLTSLEQLVDFFADSTGLAQGSERSLPESLAEQERQRRQIAVLARESQGIFRQQLLEHFKNRCLISGCDVPEALEAAHIMEVSANGPDVVENGLLLRADLHRLFDARMLRLVPDGPNVVVEFDKVVRRCAAYAQHHLVRIPAARLERQLAALRQRASCPPQARVRPLNAEVAR